MMYSPRKFPMNSVNVKASLLGDPANTRRRTVTGPSGVKLATEDSARMTHQVLASSDATGARNKNKISIQKQQRIATWNVRGLISPGKLEIVEKEAESHNLTILGITETHMRGQGHQLTHNGNTLYFSGPKDSSRNGVAIWLSRQLNNHVLGYNPISDRIMSIRLNTRPCTLNVVVVYAPTASAQDEEIDYFYKELEKALSIIPNREITLLVGDFNAKVGNTLADNHLRDTVGNYGLGIRNERGTRLLEFCIGRHLTIMNTCFQQHPRRLYTWISPGDRCRNQIDYIMINSRWKTSVTNVKTYPGADCGSDHCMLLAKFTLRLKSVKKKDSMKPRTLAPAEASEFRDALDNAILELTSSTNVNTNEQWENLKGHIWKTVEKVTKNRAPPARRQMWLSSDTWKIIEDRKALKASGMSKQEDRDKYSELTRLIQKRSRYDKNNFIMGICKEIEGHALKVQTADLFKKVRLLSKQFKPRTWVVEDESGIPLQDIDAITHRWRKYCIQLYNAPTSTHRMTSWDNINMEPPIIRSEVTAALAAIKPKKAPGPDQLTAEILKAMGPAAVDALHKICNDIWHTGDWPNDWTKSVILPLHKKGTTTKCDNYRTLALLSHASKILLHIINNRIRHFLDWQIPQEQAGFVKGKGTREQILNIRQLIEKSYEFNTPLILCFIDYSKAFDCVVWSNLWKVLRELGVPEHLVALIKALYRNSQGVVKIDHHTSEPFSFGKGVRQGCILSPILFNAYGECIIRRACENWHGGVTIGGIKVSNLRYADDTTLLAASEAEMVDILSRMERISLEMGLKINHNKTKLMIVDRSNKLQLTGALSLETVEDFIYLGANINNTGSCEKEIRRRIGMAKTAMTQLQRIWRDRNISRKTKIKLVNSLVFSIFSYGAETWTLKKADRDRIDAFEMWCWRRMLQIPWTAFRTNVSILRELKIKTRLSTLCLRKILEFFGHIARKEGHNLEQLMVTGKVDGKRPRGRSPTRWTDQIRTNLDTNLHDALHAAKERNKWRDTIKRIGNHDPQ